MLIWTDGSAALNRDERCIAGASWCVENGISAYVRLTGIIPNNNLAEVTTAVMALWSWQSTDLHIHTDSKFVLELVNGGLLAMEQDGWPNLPLVGWAAPVLPVVLYKHFLFLICWHNSALAFSWVKGHSGDAMNKQVDALARKGMELDTHTIDLSSLWTPSGWVDSTPMLNHQTLSHLTYCMVWDAIPSPLLGRNLPTSAWNGQPGSPSSSTRTLTYWPTTAHCGPWMCPPASRSSCGRAPLDPYLLATDGTVPRTWDEPASVALR